MSLRKATLFLFTTLLVLMASSAWAAQDSSMILLGTALVGTVGVLRRKLGR